MRTAQEIMERHRQKLDEEAKLVVSDRFKHALEECIEHMYQQGLTEGQFSGNFIDYSNRPKHGYPKYYIARYGLSLGFNVTLYDSTGGYQEVHVSVIYPIS